MTGFNAYMEFSEEEVQVIKDLIDFYMSETGDKTQATSFHMDVIDLGRKICS